MSHADYIRAKFPNASRSFLAANSAGIPDSEQREQPTALEGEGEGEAQGTGCAHICFTLCRVKLLDIDAKYASTKDLIDGLAIARIIRGDREGEITLEVRQEKVRHYKEEKTIIEITLP